MNRGILVGGELSFWHAVGGVLGLAAVVGGMVMVASGQPVGWGVAAGGMVVVLSIGSAALIAGLRRRWVEDLGTGLAVRDRQGRREYRDEQVMAIALDRKRQNSGGETKGTLRTFRVWLDDSPAPISMVNTVKTGQPDPLAGLIERLVNGLAARMNADIDRGGSAGGEGWRVDRTYVTLGKPGQEEAVPHAEITAVEVFEGKMCVWRRGRDDAFFKTLLGSRNAHLLPVLLGSRMPSAEERKEEPSATGLGRILFERRPPAAFQAMLLLLSTGAVGVGIFLLFKNLPKVDGYIFLAIALALSVLFVVAAVALRYMVFRCHERGVFKANLLGEQILNYDHVAAFTYSATRHYHNGVYVGTHLNMKFQPVTGSGAPAISYAASVQVADDDLDELRDFISRRLADRMAEQLSTGQPVPWTPNLTFFREGIQYRPAGMLGLSRKEPHFLPYDAYGGCNLNQGVFYLFVKGGNKPIMTEPCNATNFFPGFYLLMMMTAPSESQA